MPEETEIAELAIAVWRMEKWLNNLNAQRKMAARSSLRTMKKYLDGQNIEIIDPVGQKFDEGLAIEVLGNHNEELDDDRLIIAETVTPYIYQNGRLIRHARVILGKTLVAMKENHEIQRQENENSPSPEIPVQSGVTLNTSVKKRKRRKKKA